MFAKILAFATLCFATTQAAYPLFKQCDSRWSADRLGTSSNTICSAGCLMSSVSMVLNGCGKTIDGGASTPKSLNHWLTNNGGYASGDLFVWGAVSKFGLGYVGQITDKTAMHNHFSSGKAVILNVNNGGHWVLMTGSSGANFLVNDPGFSKTSYTSGEVVRAGIFNRPAGCNALAQAPSDEVFDFSAVEMIDIQEVAAILASEPTFLME